MTFFSRMSRAATRRSSSRLTHSVQLEKLEDRCLLTAGALDTTFGTGGLVVTDLGSTADRAFDVVIQSDGKIITVGDSKSATNGQDFAVVRYLANGSVDTSFGTGGKAVTDFKRLNDVAKATAIQVDGKIVAAGSAATIRNGTTNLDFALVRYNANGTLDTSFGTKGKVTTAIGTSHEVIEAMGIQADGKLVVAGYTNSGGAAGGTNFALARYNTNGSLDSTFGTGGVVVMDFHGISQADQARSLAIQPDGKIVVTGEVGGIGGTNGQQPFGLARFNSNGTLDTSFGVGGKVTTLIGSVAATSEDVAIQTDGRIVVSGYSDYAVPPNGTRGGIAVARYLNTGALDTTFGTSGVVTFVSDTYGLYGGELAIQANGKIVVASQGMGAPIKPTVDAAYDFVLLRLNGPDGSVDTTFGTGGLVTTDFGPTFGVIDSADFVYDIELQADGRIVAAGAFNNPYPSPSNLDIALARYEGDAPLQAAFAAPNPSAILLTDSQVQPLLSEALTRWQTSGADVSGLGQLDIRITNLGGNYLGMTDGHTIWLDDNAAGWGWFMDATPGDNREFATVGNQGEKHRMDLLTVVMHELGHLLGYAHADDGVMFDTLAANTRVMPAGESDLSLLDSLFGNTHDEWLLWETWI